MEKELAVTNKNDYVIWYLLTFSNDFYFTFLDYYTTAQTPCVPTNTNF